MGIFLGVTVFHPTVVGVYNITPITTHIGEKPPGKSGHFSTELRVGGPEDIP